ncbi:MAG: hypothetical protein ACREMS_02620 [Gemmatimonadaceae bacterium]
MLLIKLASSLTLACALANSARAQPAGYHVGAPVILPDSLSEVLSGGRFRATILRVAANRNDARLIAAAEELYPAGDSVLASAANAAERNRLLATVSGVPLRNVKVPQRAAGNPADRWWLDSFDDTWIPFAVTGSAVEYYLGRLHDYAAGLSPFGFSATDGMDRGGFSYSARVLPGSEGALRESSSSSLVGITGAGFFAPSSSYTLAASSSTRAERRYV